MKCSVICLKDESIKKYLNAQSAVPCKKGDFEVTPELEEMRDYIEKRYCSGLSGPSLPERNVGRCNDPDISDG